MHIHILGICGTFMGGLALLARETGHTVSGSDANVYPPMSTLLEAQGIDVREGFDPEHLRPAPDVVLIGNVMARGNPVVEYVLNKNLPFTSGPQWLYEHILQNRWVLACAGTHGKTTTSSILVWILEDAGLQPGFLIGGVPQNFGVSAQLGQGPWFVVEADEYDTAFFDKRSKFVHYHPRTLVLNNLEYDHADIFEDLSAIQRQFHHVIRTVPGEGRIVVNGADRCLAETLRMGCWTPQVRFGADDGWQARLLEPDASRFEVWYQEDRVGCVTWTQAGRHNALNALGAIAAAQHAGVAPEQAIAALTRFEGVKRRLEVKGGPAGITLYDDFAHHPTAIRATLEALRARVGPARILAVLEPRSNSMRSGAHREHLVQALAGADQSFVYQPPELGWSLSEVLDPRTVILDTIEQLVDTLACTARPGDHILIMSNGGFGGLTARLTAALTHEP